MINKKVRNIALIAALAIILLVGEFYTYIGIQFGNAAIESAERFIETKKKWDKEGTSPIDTISQIIKSELEVQSADSLKVEIESN